MGSRRAGWLIRTGWAPVLWLLAAAATELRGLVVEVDRWVPVHLVMLGSVSNVVLVWSAHFTNAVLRTSDDGRPGQVRRLVAFNAGAVLVVGGVVVDSLPALTVGAVVVGLAVLAHARWLLAGLRVSLPARFARTVHYYLAAAVMLVLGITAGVVLEHQPEGAALAPRLLVAHLTLNLVGWVSLTVVGTLVTLWPTMLRTPMRAGAERMTFSALPWLAAAVLCSAAGALLGVPVVAAGSLVVFLVVVGVTSRPLAQEARRKPPRDLATRSVLAGGAWFVVGLLVLAGVEVLAADWDVAVTTVERVALPALVLGFAVQTVVGALTYLVPVMLGGGPGVVRGSIRRVERLGTVRLAVLNAALVAIVLGDGAVRVVGAVVCVVAVLATVAVLVGAVLAARPAASARTAPGPASA